MKVLYIAYSCSPTYGSEDAIGWNIPYEFAKSGNESYIITKLEHKRDIEVWLSNNNDLKEKLHFSYIKIPKMIKKIANGPLYSLRLYYFKTKCKSLVEIVCNNNHINTVHQITPVEFRSIVDLRSYPELNFIVGPVAGAQTISNYLWKYLDNKLVEIIRMYVNKLVLCSPSYRKKVNRVNSFFFANKETYCEFEKNDLLSRNCIVIPEVGIKKNVAYIPKNNETFTFALIGRLISIKGYEIVLDALSLMRNQNFRIIICGEGPQRSKLQRIVEQKGISNKVDFKGFVSYVDIQKIYKETDVLIMPSLREATGTVSVEAMLNGVPVITFNQFGASEIVNNENGWLVDLSKDYLTNLAKAMDEAIEETQMTLEKGKKSIVSIKKCEWIEKLKIYSKYYI